MNTKLTLTLEREVIEQAKKYASQKGRSLSEMVESYFKYITTFRSDESEKFSPRIKRLRGIMKVDADFDYKKTLDTERSNKHGA